MGNTIDLLSTDSDNESHHSDPASPPHSSSPPHPENKTLAAKPKSKSTKPTTKTNEKEPEKDEASIESRGFHRHGKVSWYNAELVMLGMAYALLPDRKAINSFFPHRSPSAIASCLQRTTKSEDKGWIMPKEADCEEMAKCLGELKDKRMELQKGVESSEEEDEEVVDEMEKLKV